MKMAIHSFRKQGVTEASTAEVSYIPRLFIGRMLIFGSPNAENYTYFMNSTVFLEGEKNPREIDYTFTCPLTLR